MHFRILKVIATSGFLTALECTKFVFGLGSVLDPAAKLAALPRPPSWFKGALILRGMGGEGTGRRRRGEEGKGRNKRLGRGGK